MISGGKAYATIPVTDIHQGRTLPLLRGVTYVFMPDSGTNT